MNIQKVLDLSTAHVHRGFPEWGDVRIAEHEEGWILFVNGDIDPADPDYGIPEWLQPAYQKALDHGCSLINFDKDGDRDDTLPTWEW
jgi:hypothetical protein